MNVNFHFKMILSLRSLFYLLMCQISILFLTQCELVAPTIVKELANGLDPLKTCEKVKLCTNGTLSTFKET